MILPLITHAPSILLLSLPHMSTHPALHDTACVPHVHGKWHAWVTMHLLMSIAALAVFPIRLVAASFFFVAMVSWQDDRSWANNS